MYLAMFPLLIQMSRLSEALTSPWRKCYSTEGFGAWCEIWYSALLNVICYDGSCLAQQGLPMWGYKSKNYSKMKPVLCKGEARKGIHLTSSRPPPVPAVRLDTWLLWAPSMLTYLYSSSAYLLCFFTRKWVPSMTGTTSDCLCIPMV